MTAESAAFYSTAAQVLPVLFLAIVFEQRVWSSDAATRVFGIQTGKVPNRPFTTAVAVLTVTAFAALFVGEWLAIAAVGGSEADVARYFVTGALVIAGVLVVLPPVLVVLPGLLPTRWAFAKPAPDRWTCRSRVRRSLRWRSGALRSRRSAWCSRSSSPARGWRAN